MSADISSDVVLSVPVTFNRSRASVTFASNGTVSFRSVNFMIEFRRVEPDSPTRMIVEVQSDPVGFALEM